MANINKVIVSGRLTANGEMRATATGTAVATLRLAVNDRRKNPSTGEWDDAPNFINCVMFGQRAQALEKYLIKGTKVTVEGKLRWSSWEKDGAKRSKIEIIIDEIELMSTGGERPLPDKVEDEHGEDIYAEEDIPF
jgi:single-strand DNA-binding protein